MAPVAAACMSRVQGGQDEAQRGCTGIPNSASAASQCNPPSLCTRWRAAVKGEDSMTGCCEGGDSRTTMGVCSFHRCHPSICPPHSQHTTLRRGVLQIMLMPQAPCSKRKAPSSKPCDRAPGEKGEGSTLAASAGCATRATRATHAASAAAKAAASPSHMPSLLWHVQANLIHMSVIRWHAHPKPYRSSNPPTAE